MKWPGRLAFGVIVGMLTTTVPTPAPVWAQFSLQDGQFVEPEWGTDASQVLTLHAMGFVPEWNGLQWTVGVNSHGTFRSLNSPGPPGCFRDTLALPEGALVTAASLDGCDDAPGTGEEMSLSIERDPRGPSGSSLTLLTGSTSGAPGCQSFNYSPSQPFTIDNDGNAFLITVCLPANTLVAFKAVRITYRLQVSPAPSSATFWDVPTNHWAFQHIEALAASGITAGCGGGAYCPDAPLTRAQMAVFLAKALGLHWE